MISSIATNLACNTHGSDVIGRMIDPILRQAAAAEGYWLLPRQERPVVINTKGPYASGKSTLRPLQPLYELWDDAMALAEFDASRCAGDYGYDEQYDGWWAHDHGRRYRFVIEPVAPVAALPAGARDGSDRAATRAAPTGR